MTNEDHINKDIQSYKESEQLDTNLISDGYHTFGELYEHRIALFIALALSTSVSDTHSMADQVWRSPIEDGWFLLGIGIEQGKQITYHLPESKWEETNFATLLHKQSYQYDGHTSKDVLKRISQL